MKRILKVFKKTLLFIIATTIVVYIIFRVNEYFVGNKYVSYLENNTITSSALNSTLELKFDKSYYDNQLFVLGEIHEVSTSPLLDVSTFKDLHQKENVKIYLAEMDLVQAYYLNKYLKDITDLNLNTILKKWVISIGKNSKDYREQKWGKLKKYYKTLNNKDVFQVYGIDKIADYDLLKRLLKEKIQDSTIVSSIPNEKVEIKNWIKENISKVFKLNAYKKQDSLLLRNIAYNINNLDAENFSRDHFMFNNFKRYIHQNKWTTEKMYGCFGLFHVLQGSEKSFSGKIKNSKLFEDKFVSTVSIYTNSYLTVPSKGLPSFIADKGDYTKLGFGYDNIFLFYIRGIEDFKRASLKNAINVFKLDAENSPYKISGRGLKNFQLLPLLGGLTIDKSKVTTDYIQYVYHINGADWMNPY